MANKTYVSVKTIHIGSLKMTIIPGTEINEINENQIEISGKRYDISNDFKICLEKGFFVEKEEGKKIKIEENKVKKVEKPKKMEVIKSNEDLMMKKIEIISPIKNKTKNKTVENSSSKEVRGMKVIKDDSLAIEDKKIVKKIRDKNVVELNKEEDLLKLEEETKTKEEQVNKRRLSRKRESEKNQKMMRMKK